MYRPFLREACGGCHIADGYIHPPITADATLLVGVQSFGSLDYVTPGSPEQSLLWLKVNGLQGADAGTRMPPPTDADALPAPALAAIEAWIRGGARP